MQTYRNFLKLHQWVIEIKSPEKNILQAVAEHIVGIEENVLSLESQSLKRNKFLRLEIIPFKRGIHRGRLKTFLYIEDLNYLNLKRGYNFKKRQAAVFYPCDLSTSSPVLYHQFFLEPISQMLRAQKASLIHGAVLAYQGDGVLLIGPKGAGKSSLSVALIELGFEYFGDEHPILSLEKTDVFGRSFPSAIALDSRSREFFSQWEEKMVWHSRRGKYLLNPNLIRKNAIGTKCKISKIVFLKPCLQPGYRIQSLKSREVFLGLLKDDYLAFHDRPLVSNEATSHLELIARLSEQVSAVQLMYGDKNFRRVGQIIKEITLSSA